MCQLTLTFTKPASGERRVWKEPEANESDEAGGSAFNDEEPSPASDTSESIHAGKDPCGDQAGESGGEDLGTVKHGDAGGNFSAGVEDGEHVGGTGIELC